MKFLILFILVLSSSGVLASTVEHETFLSNHFTDVIKSYDSRGVVRVDIKLKSKKIELPGTNFMINSNEIGDLSKKNVKSVTVNVFTELIELPPKFKEYVDQKTKDLSSKINIKFIQLEKQTNGLETQISNGIEKLSTKLGGSQYSIYALLTIPVAIILMALFFKGQLNKATQSMGAELQGLTAALQEQGIGTTSSEAIMAESYGAKVSEGGSTILEQSMWEMMNIEFFKGLLSDCYWCHEDEYASFVWTKVPVKLKRDLLESEEIDEVYIKHISNINPVDKGFGSNSYYLKPWKYSHISNEDLSSIVNEDKRFFGFLSPMRLNKLELTLEEKLQCVKAMDEVNGLQEELFSKKIANTNSSEKRIFETAIEFEFSNFEEENKLLEMDVEFSMMKKFPSLGWMLRLDNEKIVSILSQFQARELAGALYTSNEIKEKLLNKMPEKRRELINSYVAKVEPMRNNIYSSLLKSTYKELELINLSKKVDLKEVKSA